MAEHGTGRPRRAALTGLVLAAILASPLAGCIGGEDTIGRVFAAVRGDVYALSENGEREIARFGAAYEEFAAPGSGPRQREHFREAFKRVRLDYVLQVKDAALIDAAIKGVRDLGAEPRSVPAHELVEAALDAMLASLDPHSAYLNPEELRDTLISTKGEFGGLGIEITLEDGRVRVVSPIEDTPAYRAGIKPGDVITHLDGDAIAGMSLSKAVHRMRGRPGTDIRLTLERAGQRPFEVTVTRAIIRIQAVRWHIEGDIGYVRVASFNEGVQSGVSEAMAAIDAELGPRLRGVVLDLRNNPGGLLDQSVALADMFLDSGVVVSVRGRGAGDDRVSRAQKGDLAHGRPMVVLINGGSASASEIVAVALQDNARATIMGIRSFGKGTVQRITRLPLEGALRLTTALYYSPSGRAIQARGVFPDIAIVPKAQGKRQREADLSGALPGEAGDQMRTRASLEESACPAAGKDEDRALGCALAMLRAGSAEKFLASSARRPPM